MSAAHGRTGTSQELRVHTAIYNDQVCDVYKLIDLAREVPEEIVPIDIFAGVESVSCWTTVTGRRIGPSDILALIAKYDGNWQAALLANIDWVRHIEGVRDAQYERYPLLVVGDSDVVDGMHRLTRAWLDQTTTIKIKRFQALPAEAVLCRNSASAVRTPSS